MKPGTIIRLPDGREGTVVYHSLDGYGIRWGRIKLSDDDLEYLYSGHGGLFRPTKLDLEKFVRLRPEAMLRDPSMERYFSIPCVGEKYEIVAEPEADGNGAGVGG